MLVALKLAFSCLLTAQTIATNFELSSRSVVHYWKQNCVSIFILAHWKDIELRWKNDRKEHKYVYLFKATPEQWLEFELFVVFFLISYNNELEKR